MVREGWIGGRTLAIEAIRLSAIDKQSGIRPDTLLCDGEQSCCGFHTPPACSFQSRQIASRWESNPPLSNLGERLTQRLCSPENCNNLTMAWDPDTRPTRTTSGARRLPAHALRRISSTFCASDRRSGGASPRQALAWRCQRGRYGWATSDLFASSFHQPHYLIGKKICIWR